MRILTLAILLFSSPLLADMQKELNDFFERFGSQSNVSSAEIYNGQKAGYLTGGGVTIRNRVMDRHPLTVNLPKFDAGCGGIDLYSGGFSFINSQQLIDSLKSVGSSATGYAFLLGLETVSPQVANTIKNLQTWANNINTFNINSCEAAAGMVGSVWPRETQASQHVCRTLGGANGLFDDYLKARHNCAQSSENQKFKKWISERDEYKDLLFEDYNLTWRVIQKQPYLAKDQELSELVMALMGTFIVKTGGEGPPFARDIPSKIHDEGFLKSLLEGGELAIYTCEKGNFCLCPQEKKVHLPHERSWTGKVQTQLLKIQEKILRDEELSESEKALLTKITLPLYKVVNVMTAYRHGTCPIDLYQLSYVVALDLLAQFLKESIQMVREACYELKLAQMFSKEIDEFLSNLDRIEQTVRQYENRAARFVEQEFQLIQKMKLLEEQIAAEIVL